MIYKGYNFRKSATVYPIFSAFRNGDLAPYAKGANYVSFGRLCHEPPVTVQMGSLEQADRKERRGAAYQIEGWKDKDGNCIFAKPIKLKGHSLTNMAYGEDGKVYLLYDGKCYTAKMRSTPPK